MEQENQPEKIQFVIVPEFILTDSNNYKHDLSEKLSTGHRTSDHDKYMYSIPKGIHVMVWTPVSTRSGQQCPGPYSHRCPGE